MYERPFNTNGGKTVHDNEIIALYWNRSETAIAETEKKYGKYCRSIAYGILRSDGDAEECVNDAYVKVWNVIPPQKPQRLSAFIGAIIRNIALNRYERDRAQKRYSGIEAVLDEVSEFVPNGDSQNEISDDIAIKDAINRFLSDLSVKERVMFVRRYWYMSTVKEIAGDYGYSESKVKVTLMRVRNRFKEYLEKEGINV